MFLTSYSFETIPLIFVCTEAINEEFTAISSLIFLINVAL
jgi:hypothetical protein